MDSESRASTEPVHPGTKADVPGATPACFPAAQSDLLAMLLNEPSDKYERRIARAKQKEYPRRSAADWTRDQQQYSGLIAQLRATIQDTVPRVDGATLVSDDFIERFEAPNTPVVVTGLQGDWPAHERWALEALLREYGGERFKVGEDDEGYAVYVKLRYYLRYLLTTLDDSPLYIFDSSFAEREATRNLRHDYSLPKFFTDDLFKLVGEKRRPPYRWLVLGPGRSGSYIHIDPLGTSAWNALLQGHKCWALFPPGVPKEVVQPGEGGGKGKQLGGREAIAWFANVYPKLVEAENPEHQPLTIIQGPGETIFVPGGWWHVVLNLDVTVAVTQNFCSRTNFDSVWRHTRKSRPKMARKLREQLRLNEPALFERTLALEDAPDLGNASSSSSSSSSSSEVESDAGERRTFSPARASKMSRKRSRSRSRSHGQNPRSTQVRSEEDESTWRDVARRRAAGGERSRSRSKSHRA